MKKETIIAIGICYILLSSCKVQNMFTMDKKKYYATDSTFYFNENYEYKLKIDDKLNLSIWDHDDLSVGSIYGIYNSNEVYGKWQLIDHNGNVALPQIGTINLEGLTIVEAEQKLQKIYAKYIKNPVIKIKILNQEIAILGEVRNPGNYNIEKENIRLLDVLGRAGNMEYYADVKHIKIVRRTPTGMEGFCADMSKMENIDLYNIRILPGDVIYVPAKNGKLIDKKLTNLIPITNFITTIGVWNSLFNK